MRHTLRLSAVVVICLQSLTPVLAGDWNRFRGPDGSGISSDAPPPLRWDDETNLKWKTPLPGPGSSSPIVTGERVFVTCYSGAGGSLARQVVCVDRNTGDVVWSKSIDAAQPEDPYNGYLTEHGYASNTPVTDGERVYAFFGKGGVYAFDLDGNQLWQVSVGTQSSNRRWGSAASLVLYGEMVIVNAADESRSIRALDRETGEEVWNCDSDMLELAYGTPTLVPTESGTELVIGVPGEIWGVNADNGKLRWYAETNLTGNICPSVVAGEGVVYLFGGYRSSGSHAFRPGGRDDVTASHEVWSTRNSSYVATPLLHEGHLYWVDDRGLAFCVSAESGEEIYRVRLEGLAGEGKPVYASPVLVDGKIYVVSRWEGTFVFAAQPEFEQLALNRFASDESDFSGTPAVSDGELFLRSNEFLYCVSQDTVQ